MSLAASTIRSLRRRPIRSALTTLGVVVGVAAVVTTTSIGNGARERITEALTTPESRTVYLNAVPRNADGSYSSAPLAPSDSLHADDYYAIRRHVRDISAASPQAFLQNASAKAIGRSINVMLEGVDAEVFDITRRALLKGDLLNEQDVRRAATVCVISESLARKLFRNASLVGHSLQINGVPFTIIGIVDDIRNISGTGIFGQVDLHVYVPFTSLLHRLNPTAPIFVTVQARDVEHVAAVQEGINDLMAERQRGRRAEFLTSNAIDSVKAYSDGAFAVARLLVAMGAISLTVGGIGIMNVMMIAVGERTREIGIRMAVGTRARSILIQFLMEAVALGASGGVIGVVVGVVASQAYARVNGWPMSTTAGSIVTAVLCSVVVGMLSGVQPARRAAALSPVLAIRNDA